MKMRHLAVLLTLAVTASGCYVRARARVVVPRAHVRVVAVEDYEPAYYEDNIVYYDDVGEPYYYVDGRIVYIPRSHPRYGIYVSHYRTHRDVYIRWHAANRGHRYYRRGSWRVRRR